MRSIDMIHEEDIDDREPESFRREMYLEGLIDGLTLALTYNDKMEELRLFREQASVQIIHFTFPAMWVVTKIRVWLETVCTQIVVLNCVELLRKQGPRFPQLEGVLFRSQGRYLSTILNRKRQTPR